MNQQHDHFMSALLGGWGYAANNEREKEGNMPSAKDSELILAGVHSCVLAQLVLDAKWADPDSARVQACRAAALRVLEGWGLKVISEPAPTPPKKEEPEVIVWPPVDRAGRPLKTKLPDVYRQNYYHVHEFVVIPHPSGVSGDKLLPEQKLRLLGAFWNEESNQWRMKFSCPPLHNGFWLNHCQVRCGEEIPEAER